MLCFNMKSQALPANAILPLFGVQLVQSAFTKMIPESCNRTRPTLQRAIPSSVAILYITGYRNPHHFDSSAGRASCTTPAHPSRVARLVGLAYSTQNNAQGTQKKSLGHMHGRSASALLN